MFNKLLVVSLATCLSMACITNVKAYEKNEVMDNYAEEVLYLDDDNCLVSTLDEDGIECYVNPRGATDEYYYLESYRRYGSEFVLKTERYSQYYNAGKVLIRLANVSSVFWKPVNDALLEATYRIEVGGQFSRYATYTRLKVPSKKVYSYN